MKIEDLPRWATSKKHGKRIVLNEHDGMATQGLIENGRGAIAFWMVSGYVPLENRIIALVRLSDSEAQAVFDADPNTQSFLEPVWRNINDNRVVVYVQDLEGRDAQAAVRIDRDASVSSFLGTVRKTAQRSLSTGVARSTGLRRRTKLAKSSGRAQKIEGLRETEALRKTLIAKQAAKKKAKQNSTTRAGSDLL